MKNEVGHRALSKTLAVDLLVTVRSPAVCVDATFPALCFILVFSRLDCGAIELETLYEWS